LVYSVRILAAALQDARDYYEYIAEDSPDNAASWFNGLFEVIDSLATMPNRCIIAPEALLLGQDIRCLIYRKHYRILYSVEGQIVRIYHIRHRSQQPMSHEDFFAQSFQGDDE